MKRHAGLVAAAALLAACSSPDPGQAPPPPPAAATSAPQSGQEVVVTETDYEIALPQRNLSPGTYTFTVHNRGPPRTTS
ncbi:hypothetical protein ACQPW3_15310 [Actinosynnema sp. CA-248983]